MVVCGLFIRHQEPLKECIFFLSRYDTQDGLFDVSWSEIHQNQLVTSSGDGTIQLWDVTLPDFPVQKWKEHSKEVFSVSWNLITKDVFLSSSWDLSIKLWSPERRQSIQTWQEHTGCVYTASFSPHAPELFASASGDHTVKVWDIRTPGSIQTVHAHGNEVLTLDWNKYRQHHIVTGSVDTTVRLFDLRMSQAPIEELRGHEFAVRRVKCSPHDGNIVASVSYDMTVRLWDLQARRQIFRNDEHSEFVTGIDFSLFIPGRIATCGWDEKVLII
jgi:peroxin-7